MRRKILVVGLALAIGMLVPGAAWAAAGGADLPLKGSFSGYGTADLGTLPVVHPLIVTTGELSLLGLATTVEDLTVVFAGPTTFTYTGTWTMTAANGDQMFGTSSGSGFFTDAVHDTIQGTYTSSGGNGRFEDASATYTVNVQGTRLSVEGGVVTTYFEGTVDGDLSW